MLHYPHLKLDETGRAACSAEFDALIRCQTPPATPEEIQKLPVCKDKDDQKFLEIARDAHVDVLITKDKALLKLARKTRRDGLFAIMTPEAWTAETTALQITE